MDKVNNRIGAAIETVLFDLDGTLADTAPDLAYALNTLRQEHERGPLPYPHIRGHVSRGGAALVRLGFGEDLDEDAFQRLRSRFLEIYAANLCVKTRLFPNMRDILREFEASGIKWGIVTNKPAWLTDPLVEALGLARRAVCVVSGDTTDERKPHPKPLLHACELANSDPLCCLYVGDDPRDIKAGNAAGMTTLVARYGYIREEEDPQRWGADGIIDEITELLAWLKPSNVPGAPPNGRKEVGWVKGRRDEPT